MKIEIKICTNGHHWILEETCPFCENKSIKTIEYRNGDCIKCGALCPHHAYGCMSPEPIKLN